jgi:hypothetical protein
MFATSTSKEMGAQNPQIRKPLDFGLFRSGLGSNPGTKEAGRGAAKNGAGPHGNKTAPLTLAA